MYETLMECTAVLFYNVLYCTVLNYTISYCTVMRFTAMYNYRISDLFKEDRKNRSSESEFQIV